MAPKKDVWTRSRSLREQGVEAHVSVDVRGCPPGRLPAFDTLFEELVDKLSRTVLTLRDATNEDETKDADVSSAPATASQQQVAASSAGPASSAEPANPSSELATDAHGQSEDRNAKPPTLKRRRGHALTKKKCRLPNCNKRSYSRAMLCEIMPK